MIERMALAEELLGGLFHFVDGVILSAFVSAFVVPRRMSERPGRTRMLFVLFYTLIWWAGLDRWEISPESAAFSPGKQAVCFLARTVLIAALYRTEVRQLLFLSVMIAAVSDNCLFLANEWLYFVTGQFDRLVAWYESGRIGVVTFERMLTGAAIAALFLFQSLYALLLAALLRWIARFFDGGAAPVSGYRRGYRTEKSDARTAERAESLRGLRREELAFLLLPAFAGWLVCLLLRMLMLRAEEGVYQTLYEREPATLFFVPAICLLLLAAILTDVRVFSENRRAARERSDSRILAHQVVALQEEIAVTRERDAALRGLRHDMKNHIAVIAALQREGKEQELAGYLTGLSAALTETQAPFHTGSAVADALLAMKRETALREDPALVFDAEALVLPENLRIESYGLGILLANALDNALEACARLRIAQPDRERFVRLRSRPRGEMVFLEIENSFDGALRLRADGLPMSVKGTGERSGFMVRGADANGRSGFLVSGEDADSGHGLGMANMRRVVEQWDGGMECKATEGVFTLTIMLQRYDGGANAKNNGGT